MCKLPEPVRDVSFLIGSGERRILEDAIRAVDGIDGWEILRRSDFHQRPEMVLTIQKALDASLHTEDSLYATIRLLTHIAEKGRYEDWVVKRTFRQNTDLENTNTIKHWIRTHSYTATTNTFILTSYLENLLRLIDGWSSVDIHGSAADHLIFAIECVITKVSSGSTDGEHKYEVYKKMLSLQIPSDYELTRKLFDAHELFMKQHELNLLDAKVIYEERLLALRSALAARDLPALQKAMRADKSGGSSIEMVNKRIRESTEYILAVFAEKELICMRQNE